MLGLGCYRLLRGERLVTTHPFIPLYVDDFDAATAHLTPAEDGIYNRLLRLCWRTPGCSLPDDPVWIGRKIRLSPAEFERLARPILTEFFTLYRGRWVQRRLKREYDSISCKRLARKSAGKKGGIAKALKERGKSPSNATGLLADTRASPEPEPYPEDSPPPPKGTSASFENALAAYPETGRASTKPGLAEPEWRAACDVEGADRMLAAVEAFAASAYAKEGAGRRVPSLQNWLRNGQYGAWLPTREAPWIGPPEFRAAVAAEKGEPWTKAYLDPSGWRDLPERALTTTSKTAASALSNLGTLLGEHRVTVALELAGA